MKKINLDNVNKNLNLNKIQIKINHIIMNPDNRVFVVLNDEEKKQVGIELNNYEASMLSFVLQGFHKFSHINTIHQLFIKSLKNLNSKITEINIESKVGDIIYCTLYMVDKNHNQAYSVVSLADALILSKIVECSIFVTQETWEKFDVIDDWDYEDYILDIDDDDSDDVI